LEAKITKLTSKKKGKDKKKGRNTDTSDKKGDNKKKKKNKKYKTSNNGTYTKPAWQTKPPTNAEKGKAKKVNGKDYWWCEALKAWCRHKPEDCRAVNNNASTNNSNNNNRQLRLTNALETIAEETEE
jgi:hypothetical protein